MSRRHVVPVLTGVAAGFVAGWWWGRSSAAAGARGPVDGVADRVDDGWADRWGERVDAAVGRAAEGFRTVGSRWRPAAPLDEASLDAVLAALDGGADLRARILGVGLVELVGDATDDAAATAVTAVRALPGVRVVVNRVWTPSSMRPGQIDDLPGFG